MLRPRLPADRSCCCLPTNPDRRIQETGAGLYVLPASCPNDPLQYPLCCSWAEVHLSPAAVEPDHMAQLTGLSPLPWFQAKIDDGPWYVLSDQTLF